MPFPDNNTLTPEEHALCVLCHQSQILSRLIPFQDLREPLASFIRITSPDVLASDLICVDDLSQARVRYLHSMVQDNADALSPLDSSILKSMEEDDVYSRNVNLEYQRQLTFGDRLADKIAAFGGSWKFIILFSCIIGVWITINSLQLLYKPFDPYPYILLNLILSSVAALQAPVIMMSQNRQEARDRIHAEVDYRINLKAELEVRQLNAKVDTLLSSQWPRLLEIQHTQSEILEMIHDHIAQSQGGIPGKEAFLS